MQTSQNDSPSVTSAEAERKVKNPCGIFTGFIVADDKQSDKRRGEALAAAYKFILSDAWGQL